MDRAERHRVGGPRDKDFERSKASHDVVLSVVVVSKLIRAGVPWESVALQDDRAGGDRRLSIGDGLIVLVDDGDLTIVLVGVQRNPLAGARDPSDQGRLGSAKTVDL